MEEAKAASYYDDLARKGEGAARFKQGLGFSSTTTNSGSTSARQGSFATSLSSTFVKATSPSKAQVFEKEIQLNNIRDKLRGKKDHANQSSKSRGRSPEKHAVSSREKRHCSRSRSPTDKHRKRYRSRDRDRDRKKHRRHRSRSRDRRRRRHRSRSRSSSRSRSRSRSRGRGHDYSRRRRYRSRNGSLSASYDSSPRRRERIEWKSVSRSPSDSRSSRSASPRSRDSSKKGRASDRTASPRKPSRAEHADSQLTAAERVKLKIKAELSQAVSKESSQGKDANWERFDFNKTAPLDDDSEEDHSMDHAAVDDTAFLKNLGTTFSASLAQANRETRIKAAHEAAIFGAPVKLNARNENEQEDSNLLETGKNHEAITGHESKVDEIHAKGNILQNTLVSEQVYAMQQGSWRDRARKLREQKKVSSNMSFYT